MSQNKEKKPNLDNTFGNENSVCPTEENRYGFNNELNPIEIADLGWDSLYKLPKIVKRQEELMEKHEFEPHAYFGGVMYDDL